MTYAFPGTEEEAKDLTTAVLKYCTHKTINGCMQPGKCSSHELLQPFFVNHLLTVRNNIESYYTAEFNPGAKAQ